MRWISWRTGTLAAAAAIGTLAPVSLTRAAGVDASAAECATCCPETASKCVICGTKSCSSYDDSYEAKVGGPCNLQT